MTQPWRIVDTTRMSGRLEYHRGRIRLINQDGVADEIPLQDLATLLLGLKVEVAPAALQRILEFGATVLPCDWRGVPVGGAYGWSEHTRVGARQRAQAKLSLPRQKNAWAQLIRAKILGQSATLDSLERQGASVLQAYARQVRSGDPDNLEARAARYYWRRLLSFEDFARNPQGAGIRNQQLDYAYAVLRSFGVRAVTAAGLVPALGVFHRNRSNAFALVDDFVEPFRPAIDEAVARLPGNLGLEDRDIKHALVDAADQVFTLDGYHISSVLESLAVQFGRYVEGDIAKMQVDAWVGGINLRHGSS